MGLAESQQLLARLATDASLRGRFDDDPEGVAAEFGLSPAEGRDFAAFLPGPIAGFAGSLIRKRRREVESLLELTRRALGPERFGKLFRRHASSFVPSGIKKHRDDAVAFAGFLAREVAEPAWVGDLARLEAAMLLAHDPAQRWTLLKLRYHPTDLVLASIEQPIRPRASLVVWWRTRSSSRLRQVILAGWSSPCSP